jgi:hypothetical protein
MISRSHTYSIALLLLVSGAAFAQPTPGLPPFGSFSGGPFDTINNANLNVHFEIPIASKAGRGLPFTYSLTYDSSVWMPVTVGSTTTWTPVTNWGWGNLTQASQSVTGYVTFRTTLSGGCTNDGHTFWYWDTFDQFYYHDPFGLSHPVPNLTLSDWSFRGEPCGGGAPASMTQPTNDGSGYTITAAAQYQNAYLSAATNADGTAVAPVGLSTDATSTDRNGNQITASYNSGVTTFTDTLNTTALTVSGSNPVTFAYTNPQTTTSSYTVTYTATTVQTAFSCPNVLDYGQHQANLVTSIALPDGTSYVIKYEPTYSTQPNGPFTGRIASIKLPTGGTISYTYSGGNNGINCGDGSAAGFSRQTPDGTWAYSRSGSTTTIADPATNQASLTFQGLYETQRTVNMGSSGTLSVSTCYNNNCSVAPVLPITKVAATRTLPSTTSSSVQATTVSLYNSYGLPTEVDEYAYQAAGSTPPGSLVRKTATVYSTFINGPVDRPATVTVYDWTGNTAVASTGYTYDATGSLYSSSATPQHVAVAQGWSRGNLTGIARTGIIGNQSFTNYDTGNVRTATDRNGALTTYSYGTGSCGNSFVTGTALPLSLTTSAAWNCTGGVQTSSTDANSKTTTTTYTTTTNDAKFWRPSSVQDPANATTNTSYGTNPTASESALNFNGSGSTADTRTTLDGLGRPHISQRRQSPTGSYDSVETDYDSVGRPSKVTIPYSASAGGTSSGSGTVTTYNALSRPLQVTDVGGGWTKYTYECAGRPAWNRG